MNRLVYIAEIVDIIFLAGDLFRVREKSLHLRLCSTIAQLQVVKHGVVLFRKTLIGVLNILDIRAHLVCIIRHIDDRLIGSLRRFLRVSVQRLQQGRRERRCLFHVLIRGNARSFERVIGILDHFIGAILEQRLDASNRLLQVCSCFYRLSKSGT